MVLCSGRECVRLVFVTIPWHPPLFLCPKLSTGRLNNYHWVSCCVMWSSYWRWCVDLNRKPFTELRSVTCHMGSHSVSCHSTQVNVPCLNPSQDRLVLNFPTPGGMKGWVDLDLGYIPRCLTCPQTVTHPSSNRLIVSRPQIEPMIIRS